jgi:hypothetical protein
VNQIIWILSGCRRNLIVKKDLHVAIEMSFIRPEGWSPRAEKNKYLYNFVEFHPKNPTYGLMFGVQKVNSSLMIPLDLFYT